MKKELSKFLYYDYPGIEAHLSEMAGKGYQLRTAGNYLWRYEECPPEELKYCVQYRSEDTSIMAAYSGDSELEKAACEEASDIGWTLVDTWSNLRIYVTGNMDAAPLETDDSERFEQIRKVTKKSFTYPMIILMICLGWFSYMNLTNIFRYPLDNLDGYTAPLSVIMILFAAVSLVYSILMTTSWLRRSEKSIKAGGTCADTRTKRYQAVNRALYLFAAIGLLAFFLAEFAEDGSLGIICSLLIVVLIALDIWINGVLKRNHATRTKIILANIGVTLLIIACLAGFIFFAVEKDIEADSSGNADISNIPVSLMDFGCHPGNDEAVTLETSGSLFLSKMYVEDYSDSTTDYLTYYVAKIHNPAQYDWFFHKALMAGVYDYRPMLHLDVDDLWKQTDASDWGVERAYRYFDDEDGTEFNSWILGTEDYIIWLDSPTEPSDSQKSTLIQKLKESVD